MPGDRAPASQDHSYVREAAKRGVFAYIVDSTRRICRAQSRHHVAAFHGVPQLAGRVRAPGADRTGERDPDGPAMRWTPIEPSRCCATTHSTTAASWSASRPGDRRIATLLLLPPGPEPPSPLEQPLSPAAAVSTQPFPRRAWSKKPITRRSYSFGRATMPAGVRGLRDLPALLRLSCGCVVLPVQLLLLAADSMGRVDEEDRARAIRPTSVLEVRRRRLVREERACPP